MAHSANCYADFHGFLAHEYQGYYYYTGSDFPAIKKTTAFLAYTDRELLVFIKMVEPKMAEIVSHLKNNKNGFLLADHITINIISPKLSFKDNSRKKLSVKYLDNQTIFRINIMQEKCLILIL